MEEDLNMVKVLILVEGSTEERFVKEILSVHINPDEFSLIPTIITTKRVLSGPDCKGGYATYQKIKQQLRRLLNDKSAVAVTTMIDYYALPNDFPEVQNLNESDCIKRVNVIEKRFSEDINNPKFIPYLQLHEFEAILFSDPMKIINGFPGKESVLEQLLNQLAGFSSPEHINLDNPPSKRILSALPDYDKVISGTSIALEIGLEKIRKECSHFNEWIEKLESLH